MKIKNCIIDRPTHVFFYLITRLPLCQHNKIRETHALPMCLLSTFCLSQSLLDSKAIPTDAMISNGNKLDFWINNGAIQSLSFDRITLNNTIYSETILAVALDWFVICYLQNNKQQHEFQQQCIHQLNPEQKMTQQLKRIILLAKKKALKRSSCTTD